MSGFFIDTADTDYIKTAWEKLAPHCDPSDLRGITTNPNAFFKINKNTPREWFDRITELCSLVTQMRGGPGGVVYVQAPLSTMTPDEVALWAKVLSFLDDGTTKVGLKIPPFISILSIVDELERFAEINVTGLADCATALLAASYGVRYISLIPGRMEEQGINAKEQLAFVNNRKPDKCEIIAGSMRTIEGLKWTCQYGTVPTIGTKVWDLIFESGVQDFVSYWDPAIKITKDVLPRISQTQIDLSLQFFEQMDKCGRPIYNSFYQK